MPHPYTREFFEFHRTGARRAACAIVPTLLDLFQPRSVVDVGCGTGGWLAVFAASGIDDFLGIDGEYVDRDWLEIPAERFRAFDLTRPLRLERRFDLVLSLEVAEHLPPDSADDFVNSLVGLGPVVMFSAALPGQGGTHHLNEQWPDYWAERFEAHGYVPIDSLRPAIWGRADIDVWYAQNTLLFVAADTAAANARLAAARDRTRRGQLSVVHPRLFTDSCVRERAASEAYVAAAAEAATDRAQVQALRNEAEQRRAEVARHHRATSELEAQLAAARADARRLAHALTAARADVERWRQYADPHTASLRRIPRELPIVVRSALSRRLRRRHAGAARPAA